MPVQRIGALAALILSLVAPTAANAASSCDAFVNTYLIAGLPSGSTVDVTFVGDGQLNTAMLLTYPRYPVVAGILAGDNMQLSVHDGALQLQLGDGATIAPTECTASTLTFEPGAMQLH